MHLHLDHNNSLCTTEASLHTAPAAGQLRKLCSFPDYPCRAVFLVCSEKTGFEGQCLKASTTGPKPRNPNCPLASRVPRSAREDCIQPSLFSMIAAQVHLRPQDQQARLPRLVSGSLILSASLVRPQPRNFDPAAPAVDLGGGFRNRQHSFHSFHCTSRFPNHLLKLGPPTATCTDLHRYQAPPPLNIARNPKSQEHRKEKPYSPKPYILGPKLELRTALPVTCPFHCQRTARCSPPSPTARTSQVRGLGFRV